MKLIKQIWGWSDDTYLLKIDEKVPFENGKTNFVLFNYPSDYDTILSFQSMIYPSNESGTLIDIGKPLDKEKFSSIKRKISDFLSERG